MEKIKNMISNLGHKIKFQILDIFAERENLNF